MADQRKARALSGEIMAGGRRADPEILDAEYEDLGMAPAAVPLPARIATASPQRGMDMLARDSAAAERLPRFSPAGPPFWIGGVAAAAAAFWIVGGHALVLGSTAAGTGAKPVLVISGVNARISNTGQKPMLLVDAEVNNWGGMGAMPEIEIRVTGDDGSRTTYRLGTSGRDLGAGQTFPFSSRVEVPGGGVKSVAVRFAD